MSAVWLALAAAVIAYANGANDNFKGVATLRGSGVMSFRGALAWATVTTFLGSLAALLLARGLTREFSGKGLVAAGLPESPEFLTAVAAGASAAVLLATRFGLPVSTTHALIGALVGAGWVGAGAVNGGKLAGTFVAPLLMSPVLAAAATGLLYLPLTAWRRRLGLVKETCVCIGEGRGAVFVPVTGAVRSGGGVPEVSVGTPEHCVERYGGRVMGVSLGDLMDRLHVASAGAVSFARGVNDTAKIAALLFVVPVLGDSGAGILLVAVAVAAGGWWSSRRVAETMSGGITGMNHGQGLLANSVTAALVLGASLVSVPVSTTHVSCGTLFGLGVVNGSARWRMIGRVALSWIVTLPVAAAAAALAVTIR